MSRIEASIKPTCTSGRKLTMPRILVPASIYMVKIPAENPSVILSISFLLPCWARVTEARNAITARRQGLKPARMPAARSKKGLIFSKFLFFPSRFPAKGYENSGVKNKAGFSRFSSKNTSIVLSLP